ncbi:oligosaccharide flippase family protein [Leptobacterium flavescens]|uniref:Oligosaccharide flippase family protein n=1 Tax=Leptobacterium flavescens TaxID=472055 RepID=A0A6P0UIT1_9FLAO|nr:oligosaccharide flippase family protein [Leptobacterium flavescens]NER13215.1 oligosaccharide flippase family protein [Leptobacterium flavescens]
MSAIKKLFKHTFIYGLATVLPRMLNFILVPLYTTEGVLESAAEYGKVSVIFSYFVLFNVLFSYGMETAFFRFFNKEENKDRVVGTSALSIIISSSVLLALGFLFTDQIAAFIGIDREIIQLVIWILFLDVLVVIPFAWLRANERPMRYAIIKIVNVIVNLGLNLFFLLWLKDLAQNGSVFETIYRPHYQINYIFISNLVASALTLLLVAGFYLKINYTFHTGLLKKMLRYAFPVLIAGIAFSINETFDRILLDILLPEDIAETEVGKYAACYKLAVFMTLFATAFRLGIEPFFFSHANSSKPQDGYARITEYFVIFGSAILLSVVVFADVLKPIIIRSEEYWEAMSIVPLILLANLCLGIYHNLSVWYKVTDQTKYGAYISVFGALITLALNFILIPIIGYMGAAIATLAAYGSMMLLSFYLGQRKYPIPYNLKKTGGFLVLSILFSGIAFYGFDRNLFIGCGLLLVFLIMIYFSEKEMLKRIFIKN